MTNTTHLLTLLFTLSVRLPPGNMAETCERHQAERGDRQPVPGRVRGPALQGPRLLQERGGEEANSDPGRHHHHLLLAAPL